MNLHQQMRKNTRVAPVVATSEKHQAGKNAQTLTASNAASHTNCAPFPMAEQADQSNLGVVNLSNFGHIISKLN